MVACVLLSTTDQMKANFKAELFDNLRRIRHHASLALISGNNEVEEMYINWLDKHPHLVESYLAIYEDMVPELVKELCPYLLQVPADTFWIREMKTMAIPTIGKFGTVISPLLNTEKSSSVI